MIDGFGTAAHEIELVAFTTLGPAGAVAFAVLCILAQRFARGSQVRRRIEKALGVPLVVTIGGLVASAAQLGTPSNALYVLTRVGRSPLSNEMAAVVLFLGAAATLWLYSFAQRPNRRAQTALEAVSCVLAAAFVTAVGFAYSARTIITWDTPFTPVTLWLTALVGGCILALALGTAACREDLPGRFPIASVGLASAALLANVVVVAAQWDAVSGLGNYFVSAAELVPNFWALLAGHAGLCAAGIAVAAVLAFAPGATARRVRPAVRAGLWLLAVALTFAGVFVARFAFYMMHLTVGLGA